MARETYTRRQARDYDERNYIGEATSLIKGLDDGQLYELYEIVNQKLSYGTSMKKEKELLAVKEVIEKQNQLDTLQLKTIRKGRSEMARDARERDGRTTVHRKKV
jgi:hypothetical protein